MTTATRRSLLRLLASTLLLPIVGPRARPAAKRQQYIYVLRVVPRRHGAGDWTAEEVTILARHFERLVKATESRQVILAGRTTEALADTFGVVIFEADDAESARQFMQADPAVMAGLMSATLHPYAVALQRRTWAE